MKAGAPDDRGERRKVRTAAHRALRRQPALFLAYCSLRKAFRSQYRLMRGLPSIVAVVATGVDCLESHRKACELLLQGKQDQDDWPSQRRQDSRVLVHVLESSGRRRHDDDVLVEKYGRHEVIVALARNAGQIPAGLAAAADAVVELACPSAEHIAAARILLGRPPVDASTARILAACDFALLVPLASKYRFSPDDHRRLQTVAREISRDEVPSLEDLPGFASALPWARSFVADLERCRRGELSWSEIDRGILLHGPPGTGKTLFAQALARWCGLPLIAASVAKWQSAGHLGDLLGAMRKTFELARSEQPAIVFLDELDSIGDRDSFTGAYVQYSRQVVNCLLECIDGTDGRHRIVVIGATNAPEAIDRALLRSGRIERHIALQLPDADERTDILHYHLDGRGNRCDLREIAADLRDWTGADLEMLSREAKRRARGLGRPVEAGDVAASLPPLQELPEPSARRVAVHEAGHAVAAHALSPGCSLRVWMRRKFRTTLSPAPTIYGMTEQTNLSSNLETKESLEDLICRTLAGAAAEEILFGSRSSGYGGAAGSDLDRATVIAMRMVCSYGMGRSLAFLAEDNAIVASRAAALPGRVREEVGEILARQYARAMSILRENSAALERLAAALLESEILAPEAVAEILAGGTATPNASVSLV